MGPEKFNHPPIGNVVRAVIQLTATGSVESPRFHGGRESKRNSKFYTAIYNILFVGFSYLKEWDFQKLIVIGLLSEQILRIQAKNTWKWHFFGYPVTT